jgi:hypothetical protein
MAKPTLEELESRNLLSGSVLATSFLSSSARFANVPMEGSPIRGAEVARVVPGPSAEVEMERHLPITASECVPGIAPGEMMPRRDADHSFLLDSRFDPQPHRSQEIPPELHEGAMADPNPDGARLVLRQAEVALAGRLPAETLPHEGDDNAPAKHDLFGFRPLLGDRFSTKGPVPAFQPQAFAGAEPAVAAVVSSRLAGESESEAPLPPPQGSGALESLPAVALSTLESAMRRFLAGLDGGDAPSAADRGDDELWLWALAGGVLLAACETARRQYWRAAAGECEDANPLPPLAPIQPREG